MKYTASTSCWMRLIDYFLACNVIICRFLTISFFTCKLIYIFNNFNKCLYISVESVPPLSSLRLLVSPLRLTSAFMWQVVQEQNVEQFGKLEEFVSVMTNLVPELLSRRQRATLIVGLRAKVRCVYVQYLLPFSLRFALLTQLQW